ncbi:MAG TPA: type II toxin-antitoxin system RatA family toxin [Burkholderiales bacterium]|nr:type II toxin-antitoxin system RatA family toxin [Burkholderiales bacterium]
MALVEKSVLVGYSAERMYSLVDRMEDYPQFLPWCSGTTVEYRDGRLTRAAIHIDYHGLKQSFRTENTTEPPRLIAIKLVSGPFHTLDGTWRFTPLSPDACRIDFRLHYEFSSKLLEKAAGPVFGYIANSLVDAFLKRAEKLYGP